MRTEPNFRPRRGRRALLLLALAGVVALLLGRAVDLQILDKDFLQGQGDARSLRVVPIPAHRGMLSDRNGEAVAVSTPVDSVWADPAKLLADGPGLVRVAKALGLPPAGLRERLSQRADKEFVYLRRHATPEQAEQVLDLLAEGVFVQREYKRYYPAGEVMAHVLGFTDVDDRGQEGLELAYDSWLKGEAGAMRVIQDRLGRVVEEVERLRAPAPGRDLRLTVDRRLQYLAYRELKATVREHKARSGSLVLADARSGAILAMVNQPSYNPNNRADLEPSHLRNRAATDVFEPGSTIKPFTIAAALEDGRFLPGTEVDTAPGWHRVGGKLIRDLRDNGRVDLGGVLRLSSNVGASKIALMLPAERLWSMYTRVGFGSMVNSGFPGESSGSLAHHTTWRPIEQATLAYGYGLSTSALQLAQAYSVLAADGLLRPLRLVEAGEAPPARRVLAAPIARQVRGMLEEVVGGTGTAPAAALTGYRVAGKTGTVHRLVDGAYSEDQYTAIFAGMAPASAPRLVAAVVVDDPRGERYYGGQVAAPVFARVMAGALRLLDVPPDDLSGFGARLAKVGGDR